MQILGVVEMKRLLPGPAPMDRHVGNLFRWPFLVSFFAALTVESKNHGVVFL